MKSKKHLFLLGFLGVLFFVILFFSTSSVGVSTSYSFNDVAKLDSQERIEIGKLTVSNDNFLPKRFKLPNFIACSNNTYSYYLYYVNGVSSKYEEFYSYSFNYVDVSARETQEFDLFIRYYPRYFSEIYIYEVEYGEYPYDYCLRASEENLVKVIEVENE